MPRTYRVSGLLPCGNCGDCLACDLRNMGKRTREIYVADEPLPPASQEEQERIRTAGLAYAQSFLRHEKAQRRAREQQRKQAASQADRG